MQNKKHEKSQIDKFKEAARQLEADESEAAFDEKLMTITEHKPKSEKQKKSDESR